MEPLLFVIVGLIVGYIAINAWAKSQAGHATAENIAVRARASSIEITIDADAHAKSNGLKNLEEAKKKLEDLLK